MNNTVITMNRFNPKKMPNDCVCVFLGNRGSGKSNMMLDIQTHKRAAYPVGIVISPTAPFAKVAGYRGRVPPNLLITEWEPEKVVELLTYQKKLMAAGVDECASLTLDDMQASRGMWGKDKVIKTCFFNGRHYNLGFYVSCQGTLALSPEQRQQIDYVFIFRTNIRAERKKLYEHYAGMFPTFDAFDKTLTRVTENYGALVIKLHCQSSNLSDQIFFYKASLEHPGRLMEPQWKKFEKRQGDTKKHKVKEASYTTASGRVTVRQIQKRR